jgi:hypothetical protein
MSAIIQGYQLRALEQGALVQKAAQALPQDTTSDLYTVTGGAVLVTGLLGLVTTAIGATATTLALGTAPTVGTAESTGIATATAITSAEVGTWVTPQTSAAVGGALVVGGHAGNALYLTSYHMVVSAGYITWTTSANDTGQMAWYLTYVPLDTGAYVS